MKRENKTVKVSELNKTQDYVKVIPETIDEALSLCEPSKSTREAEGAQEEISVTVTTSRAKLNTLLEYFVYAHDLEVRARIRQEIQAAAQGPDKSLAKAVDDLVKAGVPREMAEATVKALHAQVSAAAPQA